MDFAILEKNARREGVTRTRLNVLIGMDEFINENGYSPSVRELSALLGIKSHSSVHFHLETLEREGYISRQTRRARSCRLTLKAEQALATLGLVRPPARSCDTALAS
jgi:SOS-response transcriptional repressor LexA